jgi:hypothetical protein
VTLLEASKYFLIFMLVTGCFGLLIRSIQEKLHPALWHMVFFLFFINFLFDLIAPVIVFFKFLFGSSNRELTIKKRIRLCLLSITVGYYFMLIDNDTFSDEKFWKPFRNATSKMKIKSKKKHYVTNYRYSAQKQVVNNSLNIFAGLQKKLIGFNTF